jgi:hypothetical protein
MAQIIDSSIVEIVKGYQHHLIKNTYKNSIEVIKCDYINHPVLSKFVCLSRRLDIWEMIIYYSKSDVMSQLNRGRYIGDHQNALILSTFDSCGCEKEGLKCCINKHFNFAYNKRKLDEIEQFQEIDSSSNDEEEISIY